MLKRVGILMLAAMFSAIVFGGCGAGAEGTAEPVETVISEMGIGETYFDPPEQVTIQIEERDKTYTWEYQYTADIRWILPIQISGGSAGSAISPTTTKMKTATNFEWMNRDGLSGIVRLYGKILIVGRPIPCRKTRCLIF